jgi:signal transduction histidine kinase
MRPLDACKIALASAAAAGSLPSRRAALEQAGAAVRCCSLSQDLWSTLSEGGFDLIVVLADRADDAASALVEQLRLDPRTAAIPSLFVAAADSGVASALLLDVAASDEVFLDVLTDLAQPQRRLRDAAETERLLREQLSRELLRAEQRELERGEQDHELRAMLNAGLGFASNLRDEVTGPLSDDQRDHVAGLMDALDRATRLLEKASARLTPSRPVRVAPASVPPRAQRTLVHLGRLAEEACALFEAVAARKGTRVSLSCDDSVCVWGDGLRLKQVLSNLIVNAIKYCPNRSHVKVHVSWNDSAGAQSAFGRRAAEFAVIDNGPGIAPEHRERIFARGYRVNRSAEVPGEGIGLAVVKEIVAQHAGSIQVESELGSGAVFKVWLPQDRRQRARGGEE